jgi:glycosyltransferase involved in cell wall biosynthesis
MINTNASTIINSANRLKKDKYNILTFPTHERYETELCKTGHEFYALNLPNSKKWNTNQTSVPINYHILPENQLCPFLNFDILLVQSKFGQFQMAQNINRHLGIPIICLEHTLPTPSTMSNNQINDMKQMVGNINVFISEFSRSAWGIKGSVIRHGIDTNQFKPNDVKEKNGCVLTVANDFQNRDYCLNFSGWKRVTKDLKVKLIGDTAGLSKAAKDIDELADEYNSCSVYFNSSTLSPIPMSLLEAMSCGCAVVSTATCMIPEIIKNGYNGFISNDEQELRSYIELLLNDQDLRSNIGKNARHTIEQNFAETVFIDNWNGVFNLAYEESTK